MEKKILKDARSLALKMKEGARSHGKQAALNLEKAKK